MTLIRVTEAGTVWPYSLLQLRADEPTKSFSDNPSEAELELFGVFQVVPTQPPIFDPATHRLMEVQPVLTDGSWRQTWELVELTPEKAEAYYRQTHPPRWLEFGAAVQAMPEINAMLAVALQAAPALAMALSVGLGKAADGDSRVFLSAWQAGRTAGLISDALLAQIQLLGTQHDLLPEFIAALAEN